MDRLPKYRRGIVAIAMVAVLLILDLVLIAIVIGGARDHDLTVGRIDTIRAFYAAEAGMEMCIRELMEDVDEDGDGEIGTISYETPTYVPADDPAFGNAKSMVTVSLPDTPLPGQTTYTSQGRSGLARRAMETIVK